MPLYEYSCGSCGHRFEVLQSFDSTNDGVDCPSCGAEDVQRLLSTFATSSGPDTPSSGPSSCGSGFT